MLAPWLAGIAISATLLTRVSQLHTALVGCAATFIEDSLDDDICVWTEYAVDTGTGEEIPGAPIMVACTRLRVDRNGTLWFAAEPGASGKEMRTEQISVDELRAMLDAKTQG
jgi:hypothetical protein